MSGDLDGTPGIIIIGTKGRTTYIEKGVIVAKAHIHMPIDNPSTWGLNLVDNEKVLVHTFGDRPSIVEAVLRISGDFVLEMHVDVDESNAIGCPSGGVGRVLDERKI
jgi:putative phosphotransacetylase